MTDPHSDRITATLAYISQRLTQLQPILSAPMPLEIDGQWQFAAAFGEQRALINVRLVLHGQQPEVSE